jgi:hypothetical protein
VRLVYLFKASLKRAWRLDEVAERFEREDIVLYEGWSMMDVASGRTRRKTK